MTKRLTLLLLTLASPLVLAALVVGTPAGEVVFALLAAAFPVALIALGAARRGRLGPLAWPLAALLTVFEIAFLALFALRGQVLDAPWLGGLPLAAAIQVYGLFLLPLPFVVLLYALTFDRFGLPREQLDELRRRFGRDREPGK